MRHVVSIDCSIPHRGRGSRLGIVDTIRDAVRAVRVQHPHLQRASLQDVSMARQGDELRLTLHFSPSK